MPWLNFERNAYGPYTRAFVGLVKVIPAGEKIILPKDRYGHSGGLVISNVALYEVNPPGMVASLTEIFPTMKVQGWSLQEGSLGAVLLARHLDGNEFWGSVLNFNTLRICYPLALNGAETLGKVADMFLPKLGLGNFAKSLGGADDKQWRKDLEVYSEPAAERVFGYVQSAFTTSSGHL